MSNHLNVSNREFYATYAFPVEIKSRALLRSLCSCFLMMKNFTRDFKSVEAGLRSGFAPNFNTGNSNSNSNTRMDSGPDAHERALLDDDNGPYPNFSNINGFDTSNGNHNRRGLGNPLSNSQISDSVLPAIGANSGFADSGDDTGSETGG